MTTTFEELKVLVNKVILQILGKDEKREQNRRGSRDELLFYREKVFSEVEDKGKRRSSPENVNCCTVLNERSWPFM